MPSACPPGVRGDREGLEGAGRSRARVGRPRRQAAPGRARARHRPALEGPAIRRDRARLRGGGSRALEPGGAAADDPGGARGARSRGPARAAAGRARAVGDHAPLGTFSFWAACGRDGSLSQGAPQPERGQELARPESAVLEASLLPGAAARCRGLRRRAALGPDRLLLALAAEGDGRRVRRPRRRRSTRTLPGRSLSPSWSGGSAGSRGPRPEGEAVGRGSCARAPRTLEPPAGSKLSTKTRSAEDDLLPEAGGAARPAGRSARGTPSTLADLEGLHRPPTGSPRRAAARAPALRLRDKTAGTSSPANGPRRGRMDRAARARRRGDARAAAPTWSPRFCGSRRTAWRSRCSSSSPRRRHPTSSSSRRPASTSS
jgi:hypothetical protein